MSFLKRRDFLKITVVTASAVPFPACSSKDDAKKGVSEDPADQKRVYPQGVASGDPTPGSIILWTRVDPGDGSDPAVTYQISKAADFAEVVQEGEIAAAAAKDHTVKLKVEGLEPATKYYYRFTAVGVRSVTGETKTAPDAASDVPVRFAFATCQDFIGRQYHAWRALLEETASAPVDFVVYLGDYIYETSGDPRFQTPTEERKVVFPDGQLLNPAPDAGYPDGGVGDGSMFAVSLEDYRTLYKTYRSDEYLQEAHRKYPFIIIWDDHEFGDDCWGAHLTHFSEVDGNLENLPDQRLAADRAWSEYQPTEVQFDENAVYPNDIKIYRKFRFGKHLELFMTDERYYRDDHVIPEGPTDPTVGKIFPNSAITSRIFVVKEPDPAFNIVGFDAREATIRPTMLGATQKQWLLDSITGSTATWKVWGSEVQNAQMVVDFSQLTTNLPDFFKVKLYLTVDQWDGYRTERAEILTAIKDVPNTVVIVGDIHASYASHLYPDFDNPVEPPAAVEYTVAGISSAAIAPTAGALIAGDPALSQLGLTDLIPEWDTLLKAHSPHYQYGKSDTNGVAIADITAGAMEVTFIHVGDPRDAIYEIKERKKFRTVAGTKAIVPV